MRADELIVRAVGRGVGVGIVDQEDNLGAYLAFGVGANRSRRLRRTRINNLLKLGIPKNDAIPFGSCSRGPWFMSRCESVQRAMPNAYLASVGLVSLLDIWSKLALNNRTA